MSLVLSIDYDQRQNGPLASLVRGRLQAELVQAASVQDGFDALGGRIPDLVLTPPFLSPKDESILASHLRELGRAAAHVQTLTTPVLRRSRLADAAPLIKGMLASLRRARPAAVDEDEGCDPEVFADQIKQYLSAAEDIRRTLVAEAAPARLPNTDEEVSVGEEAAVAAPTRFEPEPERWRSAIFAEPATSEPATCPEGADQSDEASRAEASVDEKPDDPDLRFAAPRFGDEPCAWPSVLASGGDDAISTGVRFTGEAEERADDSVTPLYDALVHRPEKADSVSAALEQGGTTEVIDHSPSEVDAAAAPPPPVDAGAVPPTAPMFTGGSDPALFDDLYAATPADEAWAALGRQPLDALSRPAIPGEAPIPVVEMTGYDDLDAIAQGFAAPEVDFSFPAPPVAGRAARRADTVSSASRAGAWYQPPPAELPDPLAFFGEPVAPLKVLAGSADVRRSAEFEAQSRAAESAARRAVIAAAETDAAVEHAAHEVALAAEAAALKAAAEAAEAQAAIEAAKAAAEQAAREAAEAAAAKAAIEAAEAAAEHAAREAALAAEAAAAQAAIAAAEAAALKAAAEAAEAQAAIEVAAEKAAREAAEAAAAQAALEAAAAEQAAREAAEAAAAKAAIDAAKAAAEQAAREAAEAAAAQAALEAAAAEQAAREAAEAAAAKAAIEAAEAAAEHAAREAALAAEAAALKAAAEAAAAQAAIEAAQAAEAAAIEAAKAAAAQAAREAAEAAEAQAAIEAAAEKAAREAAEAAAAKAAIEAAEAAAEHAAREAALAAEVAALKAATEAAAAQAAIEAAQTAAAKAVIDAVNAAASDSITGAPVADAADSSVPLEVIVEFMAGMDEPITPRPKDVGEPGFRPFTDAAPAVLDDEALNLIGDAAFKLLDTPMLRDFWLGLNGDPAEPEAPPSAVQAAAAAPAQTDTAATPEPPAQDEWGLFDPSKAGFGALVERLDEPAPPEATPRKKGKTRVVSY